MEKVGGWVDGWLGGWETYQVDFLAEAHIGELEVAVPVQEDVVGFEVAGSGEVGGWVG